MMDEEAGRMGRVETGEEEGEYVIRIRIPKRPRILPEEASEHVRNAVKESLLAFRSLFDVAIESLEKDKPARPERARRIEVE